MRDHCSYHDGSAPDAVVISITEAASGSGSDVRACPGCVILLELTPLTYDTAPTPRAPDKRAAP